MSSETLQVTKREQRGSLACRKLRASGLVPANLYGHGEENVNLVVKSDAIQAIIKHGTKMVSLTGDVKDTALVREVQWDTFGMDVLHIDLARVSTSESVEVTLPIELHGEAPGTSAGGILNHLLHEVLIRCPAGQIPEHLEVNISELQLGDSIHAGEVSLPAGAEMVTPHEELIVQVAKPSGTVDDEVAEEAEPEVIEKGKGGEEAAE